MNHKILSSATLIAACLLTACSGKTETASQKPEAEVKASQNGPEAASAKVQTDTVNGFVFEMVRVDGGTFLMGSNDPEAARNEKPVHMVTLSDFSIGKHEVTQGLWKAVMGSSNSHFVGDDRPVENVSWDEAQQFIGKLNELTGKNYRLPSEAEWEYAARGGNQSKAYSYSGSNDINTVGWIFNNSENMTHAAGTKTPNELGIHDMSGNVWEWCQDYFDKGYYSTSPNTNPKGPAKGNFRVFRGGSMHNYSRNCRPTYRGGGNPSSRRNYLGFRLAL